MEKFLEILENKLLELKKSKESDKNYRVPSLWLNPTKIKNDRAEFVCPYMFFLNKIFEIKKLGEKVKEKLAPRNWTKNSIVYNMLLRYAAAFDHDSDGKLNIPLGNNGFRETGTFLKAIAMLPYIYSLGVNTIYLLPITSIGKDGRKGSLGSPYAIKNPYKLDENLSEPILEMNVETQFKAFVESAHLLGMKIVLEFVLRTASLDSELIQEHPEWFYWIKYNIENREPGSLDESKYGPPIFFENELRVMKSVIANKYFRRLPLPNRQYRNFFTEIPETIFEEDDKIIGITKKGKKCKIPCAFADWPPDDIQPVWSDVTYLRLYNNRYFNYIAYNTIRMYDKRLSKSKFSVKSLWNFICGIIPYYIENYNIDGVMLDMGHALPSKLRSEIVVQARQSKIGFTFWEENFTLSLKSVKDGYKAVAGYLPFDEHIPLKMKELIKMLSEEGAPIPFFGTAETHNTHRAASRVGGVNFSKFTLALNCFLPCIPFIQAGFELGETQPVNTGLCFEPDELENFPTEKLPLFSTAALDWKSKEEFSDYIRKILNFRKKYICEEENFKFDTFEELENSSDYIISFIRYNFKKSNKRIVFIGNMHPEKEMYFTVKLPQNSQYFKDLLTGRVFSIVNDELIIGLKPFNYYLLEGIDFVGNKTK